MRNTRLLSESSRLTINNIYGRNVHPRGSGLFYMLFPCASPRDAYTFIALIVPSSDRPHFICVFSPPISIKSFDIIGILCVVGGIVVFSLFRVLCVIPSTGFGKAQDAGAIVRATRGYMLVFTGPASEIRSST